MRRSVTYCEPSYVLAGQRGTWKFIYTPANDLPKGTKIKFDMLSFAQDIDWEIPEIASKNKSNMIWAKMPNDKDIKAKIIENNEYESSEFEFTLPTVIKAKSQFIIFIGTPLKDAQKKGNLAQTTTQRRKPFHLYIDPKGKGDYKEAPLIFHIDIKGNKLTNLKIITPSFVEKNKRFDVVIRFEDDFGNLTSNAPEDTLIELSYENLRENLNWKLFIPETGFLTLPNLYFNEKGIYIIKLNNLLTKEQYFSSPIKCFENFDKQLFWGLLHGESEKYDSTDDIDNCLRHFRDETALQFFASSPFDDELETTQDIWKLITTQIADFNEEDRFTALLGFQWVGDVKEEGVRQFIYAKESKPILRKKELKTNSLKKIYKTHNPKEFLTIPIFTMGKNACFNFDDFNPTYERVVEIYNAWGSSECKEKEGNLFPIKKGGKKGVSETIEGSIREALNRNCRFGFVGGGLDEREFYKDFHENNQTQYSPGLTAIIAKAHSRDSIWNALYNRSCYATTGKRILLGFNISQIEMGAEVDTLQKPGLVYNRHITGFVVGTSAIKEVIIFRNGKKITNFTPNKTNLEFTYDDSDTLQDILIKSKDRPSFIYYYMRVLQEDGHVAWGSPIWIDYKLKTKK